MSFLRKRRYAIALATLFSIPFSVEAANPRSGKITVPVMTAFTVKLDQAATLLAKGQTADAVSLLTADFIGQVNSLRSEGKLTQVEADALITAAQETIQNIAS